MRWDQFHAANVAHALLRAPPEFRAVVGTGAWGAAPRSMTRTSLHASCQGAHEALGVTGQVAPMTETEHPARCTPHSIARAQCEWTAGSRQGGLARLMKRGDMGAPCLKDATPLHEEDRARAGLQSTRHARASSNRTETSRSNKAAPTPTTLRAGNRGKTEGAMTPPRLVSEQRGVLATAVRARVSIWIHGRTFWISVLPRSSHIYMDPHGGTLVNTVCTATC